MIRNQPKRIVALVAAAMLVFTACSNSPSPSASAAGGLKLVTPGKLTIGYFPNFPVTDVKDGKGIGTNGLLMQEVADALGLQAVWVPYAFAALIPALQSHRIDTLQSLFDIPKKAKIDSDECVKRLNRGGWTTATSPRTSSSSSCTRDPRSGEYSS